MKSGRKLVIGIFVSLFLLSFSTPTYAQTVTTNETVYRTTLLQLIQLLQTQIELLQAELVSRQVAERVTTAELGAFSNSVDRTAIYYLKDQSDVNKIIDRAHRDYFRQVFYLFPDKYDVKLGRLLVFDGERTEIDAFVETIPPEHKQWTYAVSEEALGRPKAESNTKLIIHELGHLVSYEKVIGLPAPRYTSCADYFSRHGCPDENSFLKQFVDQFWSDIDLERANEFAQTNNPIETAYQYYDDHQKDFVTDYAAVGPEEDFSESFMFFVLGDSSVGRLAKQKIDFFKQYSELRAISEEINN